jgi:hypothetical protein
MTSLRRDDEFFETLAARADLTRATTAAAPSRLKSKIYSTLMLQEAAEAPLASFAESKAAGRGLCVFEELVQIAPVGQKAKRLNICRVCHARVLAERLENAPIYWPNCPYVAFQKT